MEQDIINSASFPSKYDDICETYNDLEACSLEVTRDNPMSRNICNNPRCIGIFFIILSLILLQIILIYSSYEIFYLGDYNPVRCHIESDNIEIGIYVKQLQSSSTETELAYSWISSNFSVLDKNYILNNKYISLDRINQLLLNKENINKPLVKSSINLESIGNNSLSKLSLPIELTEKFESVSEELPNDEIFEIMHKNIIPVNFIVNIGPIQIKEIFYTLESTTCYLRNNKDKIYIESNSIYNYLKNGLWIIILIDILLIIIFIIGYKYKKKSIISHYNSKNEKITDKFLEPICCLIGCLIFCKDNRITTNKKRFKMVNLELN
jgi:hypothetical protein